MTQTVRSADSTGATTPSPGRRAPTGSPGAFSTRGQRITLAAIVVLSVLVDAWGITRTGWSNSFYAAAVRSMSGNFTNFVFGSFDPAGVVTVDKPPMALWPQVISTWIFGFHGWAILLPQVIEAAGAVFLLHRTVRRWAGENAALLAALALAVTPVAVTVNRSDLPDTLLTLLCVAAAYAVTRAVEKDTSPAGATKWLAQAAFWIGCGFLTKMLAAWMLIPAVAMAYLFGRNASWARRLVDLAIATVVLLISSGWWVALTALWPGQKPFIGGSADGTVWNLVVGYNGFGELFGESSSGSGGVNAGASGLLRMFNPTLGGQISWLIPLALCTVVGAIILGLRRRQAERAALAGWVLWGGWLVVIMAVFSYQDIALPYYTIQLAPAIAALAGVGIVALWRYYQSPDGAAWLLLPAAVVLTAGWAWVEIGRDPAWYGWLRYVVAAVAVVAVLGLLVARRGPGLPQRLAVAAGVIAILLAPAGWSAITALTAGRALAAGDTFTAGPPQAFTLGKGGPSYQTMAAIMRTGQLPSGRRIGGADLSAGQLRMLDYIEHNSGNAQIKLAIEGGSVAASTYIIDSTATVIGMGGYIGADPVPTVAQLAQWQQEGKLAFVFSYSNIKMAFSPFGPGAMKRTTWVMHNCTVVPPSAYGSKPSRPGFTPNFIGGSADTLYNCQRK